MFFCHSLQTHRNVQPLTLPITWQLNLSGGLRDRMFRVKSTQQYETPIIANEKQQIKKLWERFCE